MKKNSKKKEKIKENKEIHFFNNKIKTKIDKDNLLANILYFCFI